MGLGSGLGGQLGIATETTPGTAVAVTRFVEFNSESLQRRSTRMQGKGLRSGGLFPEASRAVEVAHDAGGDLEFDVPWKGLGLWLQHMLGSFAATATQQGATAAYKQLHVPGKLDGKTFTLQKGAPSIDGVNRAVTYPGCKITDWELTAANNAVVTLKATIDAFDEQPPGTGALALQAASYPSTTAFAFNQLTATAGGTASTASGVTSIATGTAFTNLRSLSLKGTNHVDNGRFNAGNNGLKTDQLENDFREYSGSIDVEFSSMALYQQFVAYTNYALEFTLTGPQIAGSNYYLLDVVIPAARLGDGGSPQMGGPGIIEQTFPFAVLDDGVNNPIQVTVVSTDTTP